MKKRYRIVIEDEVYEVEVEQLKKQDLSSFLRSAKVKRKVASEVMPRIPRFSDRMIITPIGGRVMEIRKKVGDKVSKGDVVIVIESMKTQVEITSNLDGSVKGVFVREGDVVKTNQPLMEIEPSG